MPSTRTRRTVLRSLSSVAVLGAAGCVGGDDSADETKTDHVVLENNHGRERVVSVLVRQEGERVAGGRYRTPTKRPIYLDHGFEWGTYEILGKLHHDDEAYEQWQSWTWEPRSCATGDYTNDDGYWTAVLRVEDPLLDFSHTECRTEFGGPLGGGGTRPVKAGEHRLGDVTDPPTTESG